MCRNPNSEKPGSANSTINVKSLHIKDINPKHDWIVKVNYTFGGSRSISFEKYKQAEKLFNHYVKFSKLQKIKGVYLKMIHRDEGNQLALVKFYSE